MNKIITKIIGASVEGLSKNFLPKGATKYNLVRGVTAANGEFEVVSLFNNRNELIKRVISYPEKGIKKVKDLSKYSTGLFSRETIFENGKVKQRIQTSINKKNDEFGYFMTREHINTDLKRNGDFHEIARLQPGKKKKGIEYRTF